MSDKPTEAAQTGALVKPRYGMAYPFPLGGGFLAQVVVPRDLTAAEAERLQAFIAALAVPWRT